MLFKLEDFIAAPSQELLNLAKKSDLLDIASHYSIPDVKTSMLKREIKNVIIQFLVDEEFFEPSATSLIIVSQTDIQLKELELKRHLELEKLRLEFEEKRRADKEEREERMQKEKLAFEEREKEKQREFEREKSEKQRELEERLLKEKLDMEEREKAKQREMEEREKEKHREMLKEIELEKERMHYDIKMKELELSSKSMPPVSFDPSKVFDVTKHIRLVPPFQEKEVDKYFLHFEKVAENLKWPKEHWTLLLQSVVIGKAREIYTQLPLDQSSEYDTVKNLILKAYELVPEAYRQKFRNCRKEHDQTHVEFARTKEQLFDRWCSSKDVKSDHAKLRQLMLVEEFKRCIHSDVKSFLDEREVETLDVAARLADDYALTHKVSFVNKPYKKPFNPQFKPNTPQSKPFNPQQRNNSPQPNPQPQAGLTADSSSPSHNPKNKDTSENKGQRSSYSPRLFCNYCKGDGHVISECETLKRRKERQNQNNSRPTGLTSLSMAGYYRKFCNNFSVIAEPLTNLLGKKVRYVWSEACQKSFDQLKAILKSAPVLSAPRFDREFKMAVNASDVGAGSVLLQEDDNGVDHPVCYFSKKFDKHQRNYSTIEKESLSLILALQHFQVYLSSANSPIVIFSDHNPLTFIHKMKNKNQRLLRWSLMLQEHNLDIRHIKGRDNIIPDTLSRA